MITEKPRVKRLQSVVAILSLFILLLLIVLYSTTLLQHITNSPNLNGTIVFVGRLFLWLVLILVWVYVKFIERQKFLIWPERKHTLQFYILSVFTLLIILLIGNLIVLNILKLFNFTVTSTKFLSYLALFKNNIPLLIFTVFTGAIIEELIFRGFIQTRLELIFKSSFAGIFISALLFAILHLTYGTAMNLIHPFLMGIIFAIFYRKYKNIKVLIICHFIWDTLALFAAIKFQQ